MRRVSRNLAGLTQVGFLLSAQATTCDNVCKACQVKEFDAFQVKYLSRFDYNRKCSPIYYVHVQC